MAPLFFLAATIGPVISIEPATASGLAAHARIRSRFTTHIVFDVVHAADGPALAERRLATPFHKDYDRLEDPLTWSTDFDTSRWALLVATRDGERVGGALIAFDTPGVDLLEARTDLAVVWDLRVAEGRRRQGIGLALLREAEAWAVAQGCTELKVETQNVNAAACRLYERAGFRLASARAGVYRAVPDEVRMVWRKDLAGPRGDARAGIAPVHRDMTVTLRPMTENDLPLLHDWLNRPHVVAWWGGERPTLAEVEGKYRPRVMAGENVVPWIGLLCDRPFAYAQSYVALGCGGGWWEDETDPGVRGIDQTIAEPELLGRGLGTRLVRAFVEQLFADPAVTRIQVDPAPDNLRAIRCYEKAGFRRVKEIVTPDGPAVYMVQDRPVPG